MKLGIINWVVLSLLFFALSSCSSGKDNGSSGNSATPSMTVARAGADQTVSGNDPIVLDGSLSTPANGLSITKYAWSQDSNDEVQADMGDTSWMSILFFAPVVHVSGKLHFRLTVTDSENHEVSDDLVVTVNPSLPKAYAGPDINVYAGTQVSLNGASSREFDALDSLHYAWSQIGTASVILSDESSATPSFQAPLVDSITTLRFRLSIFNNKGGTSTDDVSVTVLPLIPSPTIDYLLPVSTKFSVSNSTKLDIIDNANPDKLITIENIGVDQAQTVTEYYYNAIDNSMLRGTTKYVVYAKAGKLWRMDLSTDRSQLINQLSADSDVVCNGFYMPEKLPLALSTGVFYITSGSDNDCSTPADNRLKVAYVWFTPANTALDITDLVYKSDEWEIQTAENGFYAATNYSSANKLRFYDNNFSTFSDIMNVVDPSTVHFYDVPSLRYLYVAVDNKLYVIEKNTALASPSVWDLSGEGAILNIDCGPTTTTAAGTCFFSIRRSSGNYAIYTFPADGNNVASDLLGSELSAQPRNLQATKNSLYYIQPNADEALAKKGLFSLFVIPALPNVGESPTLVDSFLTSDDSGFFTNGGAVFYNQHSQGPNGSPFASIVVIRGENSNQSGTYFSSTLAGYPHTARGRTFESLSVNAAVFVAHDISPPAPPGSFDTIAGARLARYDATSGKSYNNSLGFVPSNATMFSMDLVYDSNYGIERYYATARFFDPIKIDGIDQTDIFLMDGPLAEPVFLNLSNSPIARETLRF